ncbi:hypothetical protein C9I61_28260, partial [Klebsiella pneumoniae]
MKVNYLAPLLCIGVLALTGCNDPKKPSESNFKEAAQQYLDTVYPACYIKANFPYKTDGFNINNMPEILHAMAEKGLLTETELSRKGTVAKLAMRQPFVLFKGLTFQKLCLPGAFRPGD